MSKKIDEQIILKMQELERAGVSYSEIAKIVGKTKNSVIGALYRRRPPITIEGITIFELKNDSCRAIIGHHRYCGDKEHMRSYCLKHYNEYYQPNKKRV